MLAPRQIKKDKFVDPEYIAYLEERYEKEKDYHESYYKGGYKKEFTFNKTAPFLYNIMLQPCYRLCKELKQEKGELWATTQDGKKIYIECDKPNGRTERRYYALYINDEYIGTYRMENNLIKELKVQLNVPFDWSLEYGCEYYHCSNR